MRVLLAGCSAGTQGLIDAALDDSGTPTPTQIDTEPPAVVTEFEDCATAVIALGRELTDVITTAGDEALAEGFRSQGMAQLDSREAFLYAAADLNGGSTCPSDGLGSL